MYKYIKEIRDNAYLMYAQGMSVRGISKEIGANRHTITAWKKKYGWDERVVDVDKKAIQLELLDKR